MIEEEYKGQLLLSLVVVLLAACHPLVKRANASSVSSSSRRMPRPRARVDFWPTKCSATVPRKILLRLSSLSSCGLSESKTACKVRYLMSLGALVELYLVEIR